MCDSSWPTISIITPSLQQGAFLEATIRSVLEQDYPSIEYLVIDGGSTDETLSILKKYESRLAYWVSEPDQGQPHAINKGLRRATGEIVAYLNSDDRYLPGTLWIAASLLRNASETGPEGQWLVGAAIHGYPDGHTTRWIPEAPREPWWNVAFPWAVPQVACFWRRSLFERVGLFREDLQYCFDTEFQVRLALAGYSPILVTKDLAQRVLHPACKGMREPRRFREEQQRFYAIFQEHLGPSDRARARFLHDWKEVFYAYSDGEYARALGRLVGLVSTSPLRFSATVVERIGKRLGMGRERS